MTPPVAAQRRRLSQAVPYARQRLAAPFGRHPAYVWCFLAAFALDVFSGYSQYVGLPISGDRILIPFGIVLLLLDPRRTRLRWQDLYLVMALLVAIAGFSALAAGTILIPLAQFALLDRIIVPFVLFLVAPLVFTTPSRRDLLLKAVALIGLYLGATAIAEMFAPSLVWPRYITNPSLGIHVGRARGPFVSAETNGMTMALGFFSAALLFTRIPPRRTWRLVAGLTMLLTLAGVGLTMTRSVWLGIVLGAVLVACVHRPARRHVLGLLITVALAVAAVVAAMPSMATTMTTRLTQESSLYDRQNVNDAALRAAAAEPLVGIGWGRFVLDGNDWVRQADDYPLTNTNIEVHNVVLSRAAELGLPAAALTVLSYLLGPVRMAMVRGRGDLAGWQLLLIASIGVLVPPLMFSPNASPLPNYLIWTYAAVAGLPILVHGAESQLGRDVGRWRALPPPTMAPAAPTAPGGPPHPPGDRSHVANRRTPADAQRRHRRDARGPGSRLRP